MTTSSPSSLRWGGMYANGRIPVAMTTRRAVRISPASVDRRNPVSSLVTETIRFSSMSGTSFWANQSPYEMNCSRESGMTRSR